MRKAIAAYALMCVVWGTCWLAIKASLAFVPPFTGVGLRFLVAGIALYAVAAFRGHILPLRELPWNVVLVLATFLFGTYYALTYVAETRLDSGLVAVLFGTCPFFIFIFGHFVTKEATTPRIWIGGAIAFAGVALILLVDPSHGSPLYLVAAIVASASFAFANVYAKRHEGYDPLQTLPPAMLLTGIAIGLFGIFTEPVVWPRVADVHSIAALLYLARVGTSVAFFINLWLLQRLQTWVVGLSALIVPVIAVIAGVALGGERFAWRELIGVVLVVGGLWISLSRHSTSLGVTK